MYFLESKNLAGFGAVLHVLVEGHMRIRVAAQLPQQAIAPVSHSADSYGKHYRKLRNFYAKKFREHATHVVADTPKGDARIVHTPDFTERPSWRSHARPVRASTPGVADGE